MAMLEPGDIMIDCTGARSLLRDHLVPTSGSADPDANTVSIRVEYAVVITFLYGQPYQRNEYCKYYKNKENPEYKLIPSVDRTYFDGEISHVTGIVKITAEDYAAIAGDAQSLPRPPGHQQAVASRRRRSSVFTLTSVPGG
jgi:hypothetical protein